MSINKNIFKQTYQEFKKKIFRNKATSYNKDFDKSEEYKKLYDDDERRTKLYNYMREQLNLYDTSIDNNSILKRGRTQATIWETGTNEELKRIVEANPDLDVIFNTSNYILNSEGERQRLIRQLKANMEENKEQEDERKRLIDEKEKRIKAQQEYEKKEEDVRLENIKRLQEKAKLKKDAKTLETRTRNKEIAEAKKIPTESTQQLKKTEKELILQKELSSMAKNIQDKEAAEIAAQIALAKKNQNKLVNEAKKKETAEDIIKELQEQGRLLDEEIAGQEEIDIEEMGRQLERSVGTALLETGVIVADDVDVNPERTKPRLVVGEVKQKPKYRNLTNNEKNKRIVETTDKLRYELLNRGYTLSFINAYFDGTAEQKQRNEINSAITTIMNEDKSRYDITPQQYKSATTQAIKRSKETANNLAGVLGDTIKDDQTAPEYTAEVVEVLNNVLKGTTPEMNDGVKEETMLKNAEDMKSRINAKGNVVLDAMKRNGIFQTSMDILGLIGPAIAINVLGSSRAKKTSSFTLPFYITANLAKNTYNNILDYIKGGKPSDEPDKKDDEPDRKEDADVKQDTDVKEDIDKERRDILGVKEGERDMSSTMLAERAERYRSDAAKLTVGVGAMGLGVKSLIDNKIFTKPVTSVIDSQKTTREKINPRTKGSRTQGKQRQYSPNIIYPDDEILEPTENQLLRSEYNLAKFDFINPDNVGGNNSNGDNPLYKANDNELAIRYYDWKNMVIEKENEFVKQLPPKVSNKIIKQFRRSFVEPAEPRQTRLNYMIHDDTQFAPFNSPYSAMSVNNGTNPFIQNSILYGSVP